MYTRLLRFISPVGRFSKDCTLSFRGKYSIFFSSLSSFFHILSLYASSFHPLSLYPFHLSLSLSLSLISPSLSISLVLPFSLSPSLSPSLFSLFSIWFSLAYLMDVFVLVFLKSYDSSSKIGSGKGGFTRLLHLFCIPISKFLTCLIKIFFFSVFIDTVINWKFWKKTFFILKKILLVHQFRGSIILYLNYDEKVLIFFLY